MKRGHGLVLGLVVGSSCLSNGFIPSPAALARTWPPRGSSAALSATGTADTASWFEGFKVQHGNDGKAPPILVNLPNQVSIPQVLSEVFAQVLAAEREAVPRLLMFPNAEKLYDAATMAQLIDHLDLCKDCCEVLGMTQNTVGLSPGSQGASFAPVPAIYLKPMQNAGYDFEPDPYWDDDEDDEAGGASSFAGMYDDDDDDDMGGDYGAESLYEVPDDDGEIIGGMKAWVGAVIADLGVCPFTVDAERAGLPVGGIRYEIDRQSSPEAIYSKYWHEVSLLAGSTPGMPSEKELSTTLLITPNFGLRNREYFESFSNTLTQPLESLRLEEDIQLVFFHPEWVFRDGADRMGSDSAANFARRSPWPMINILRTPQVRKAQKAIPTGLVYRQNEVTLDKIGYDKLQQWLEERDWSEVKNNYRVDRRTVPILSTAQDLIQGRTPDTPADQIKVAGAVRGYDEDEAPSAPPMWKRPEGGWPEETTQSYGGRQEEEEDDDWDEPFDSRSMLEVDPEELPPALAARAPKSREEVVKDCVELIRLIRKRLGQQAPLTPQEVKDFETLVQGIIR